MRLFIIAVWAWSMWLYDARSQDENFNIDRAVVFEKSNFTTFYTRNLNSLKQVARQYELSDDARLLVGVFPDFQVAFLTHQLAWNHVAQGVFHEQPWMIAFCVVCNSGAAFYPSDAGNELHFQGSGLYDGVILLKDRETGSLWNHITGVCVYGKKKGTRLPIFNARNMTLKQALAEYPDVLWAEIDNRADSENPFFKLFQSVMQKDSAIIYGAPDVFKSFLKTMQNEDPRRPRMELGLGIWIGESSRYYPIDIILEKGLIADTLGGQKIAVYMESASGVPTAVLTHGEKANVTGAQMSIGPLRYMGGLWKNRKDVPQKMERPLQMFTRWYGFSLTFPGTTIYQ